MSRVLPNTPMHRRLVELVRSRRDYAARYISARYEQWRQNEQLYRAFVDPDAKDSEGKRKHPFAQSIVVPLTYAILQTQLAFDLRAMTQRKPVIPLDGVGPEDVRAAKLMEQVLHHEWTARRMLLDLYAWLLDRRRYGLGITWTAWERDVRFHTREVRRVLNVFSLEIPLGTSRVREQVTAFEGNAVHVVDPFRFWPDPRVPMGKLHEGEFVGITVRRSYSYMREQATAGVYQNVAEIPRHPRTFRRDASTAEGDSDRGRILALSEDFALRGDTVDFQDRGYVDLDQFVIKLIPKDYELGPSDQPEKWWVTIANDAVVVRAEPFDVDHDHFPVAVMEASPDVHSAFNPGIPEILQGLQEIMSWLFNSHIENVRKALNDMWLANPGVVELKDLLTPQPGKVIRIKREFYANPQALEMALKQFPVVDVTRGHLQDQQAIIEFSQRVSAAPENLQGIISQKDRTLGEQQMAVSAAQGRLQVEVQLAWIQGMVEQTYQRVSNIQQFMEEARFVQVVGEWPRALGVKQDQPFLRVGREDIQGHFTYEVIDGTLQNRQDILTAWKELWLTIAQHQILSQRYNIDAMLEWIAQMSGLSNIQDFLQPQGPGLGVGVVPDEQVMRAVEQGTLVPAGSGLPMGGRGGGNGRP